MIDFTTISASEGQEISRRFNLTLREEFLDHATECERNATELEDRVRQLREEAAASREAVKALSS